ncbi:MAG: methyltransferase [Armatimonadetes bacterium]|nr:methyltransferase [Armatimonadota bacterium]
MTSRQRLAATLNHETPDRVCVDFGATPVSGMHVSVVHALRQRVLGDPDWRVKVIEPYQMLGEVDDELREALGIDTVGLWGRTSMFGTEGRDWKEWELFDGTPCLVPGAFNLTPAPDGGWLMYPQGDQTAPASGHMPRGQYFFDTLIRQEPIIEEALDPADNTEEFGLLSEADIAHWEARADWYDQHADAGCVLVAPGAAFGDIALVPAPFLRHPRGIRDVEEWYISTAIRRDYVKAVFERQCEVALANLLTLADIMGDRVQAVMVTGTDFGTQRGPFISVDAYRDLFAPFHQRVNEFIHERTGWKTFIHSCGSVRALLPDFVRAGFDILNPVQCSAVDMDARALKREFGRHFTFWGGGVDTQKTMAFGTPLEVYREVSERVAVFGEDGGFVFNAVHNVQGNTPLDNVQALFRALSDSAE